MAFYSSALDKFVMMEKDDSKMSAKQDMTVYHQICACGKDLNYKNEGTTVDELIDRNGSTIRVLRSNRIIGDGSYNTKVKVLDPTTSFIKWLI